MVNVQVERCAFSVGLLDVAHCTLPLAGHYLFKPIDLKMRSTIFLSLMFAILCSIGMVLGDTEMSGDGATADVLGHSGKITMTYEDQTTQITMSSVTEVDSSGNVVGNTGAASSKHSFNSFASQDFTFSDVYDGDFQGIDASIVNFTCPLIDNSVHLTVELYLFLEHGNVTVGSKNYTVDPGSFKFSYYVDNWPFCTIGGTGNTLCVKGNQEQQGAFLDFEVILKGQGNAKDVDIDSTDSTITYGANNEVVLPNKYQVDGAWFTMPSGYPLTVIQGSQQIVTFRFARFSGTLDYDPFVNWGVSSNGGSDDEFDNVLGGRDTVIAVSVVCSFIGLAIIGCLVYYFCFKPAASA